MAIPTRTPQPAVAGFERGASGARCRRRPEAFSAACETERSADAVGQAQSPDLTRPRRGRAGGGASREGCLGRGVGCWDRRACWCRGVEFGDGRQETSQANR